jgi:alkanesulfonate monooxygenase SsuD/methylene tetrahydromethanopterin reductase-like flavin-dependent oxidoreductase (luciferase family)
VGDGTVPDLGVMLPLGGALAPSTILDLAMAADQAGVGAIAAGEHASTEVFALLGAIAGCTERARLETAVVSTVSRSPSLVAMAALTLADVSGGRCSIGLGAGSPFVAAWHGQRFEQPVARMRAFVDDLRTALAGGHVERWGSFRPLLAPAPVPVRIAASSPKMLDLAATAADGVILNFVAPRQVAVIAARCRERRAAAGITDPFAVHVVQWTAPGLPDDVARRTFALEVAPYLAVASYGAAAAELAGRGAIDAAADAWRRGGRSAGADAVPDGLADELLVTGGADELAACARALGASGCDAVRFLPLSPLRDRPDELATLVAALGALAARP